MRLIIAAVGRLKAGPERALVERYLERANAAGRSLNLAPIDIIEVPESPARRAEDRLEAEQKRLNAALPRECMRIALDPRGQPLTSEAFAARLAALRNGGAPAIAFLIGGPDGLAPKLAATANHKISLGSATFPHQIVRILLAEQVYRAVTILSGHPYHRG